MQLRLRRLSNFSERQEGKAAVPFPTAGGAEEKCGMQPRANKAKKGHSKKLKELREAIQNNQTELDRLTSDTSSDDDKMIAVVKQRRLLKGQLQRFSAEDVKAKFELRGEEVWYEVGLGCSVLLEELPGRPCAVWSVREGGWIA